MSGTNGEYNENRKTSKHIKEEEIAKGKWLSLNQITYEDPNGKERTWEAVYRTTGSQGEADAVAILPLLKRTLKYDCLIAIRQYRPPLKAYTIEFPAGLIDKGETPEAAAVRELEEETGYVGTAKHISPGGNISAIEQSIKKKDNTGGKIDGDEERNKNPKPRLDDTDFIEVFVIPEDTFLLRLNEFASSGDVVDSRLYSYAIAMEHMRKIKKSTPYVACQFFNLMWNVCHPSWNFGLCDFRSAL